jgi:nucleotide-binding universal stress UspA family protein
MHRNRNLLIGLSRADTDIGLIRYAAMVARLGTAEKAAFVHVLPRQGTDPGLDREALRENLWSLIRANFTGVPESVSVRCEVWEGPLLDRLLAIAAASRSDLLLIGHHLDHTGKKALARRLAMKATCSVWIVPEGSPAAIRRILVPVDFSEHSADTLRVATSVARLAGLEECFILHDYFNATTLAYEGYARVVRHEADLAFRKFLEPIDCQGVHVRPLFEEGPSISQVIHRVADERGVDLVILSTRGRSRSSAILLGSVTEEVILSTRLPLLVVKHYGARMGLLEALIDRDFLQQGNLWFD